MILSRRLLPDLTELAESIEPPFQPRFLANYSILVVQGEEMLCTFGYDFLGAVLDTRPDGRQAVVKYDHDKSPFQGGPIGQFVRIDGPHPSYETLGTMSISVYEQTTIEGLSEGIIAALKEQAFKYGILRAKMYPNRYLLWDENPKVMMMLFQSALNTYHPISKS